MTATPGAEAVAPPVARAAGRTRRPGANVRPRTIPVLGPLLFRAYGIDRRAVRGFVRWAVSRLEGGSTFSVTLRRIFAAYHGVDVGMFTHGGWAVPGVLDHGTTVGRFSSIAVSARTFTRNHPMNTRSTSALFFNPDVGIVAQCPVSYGRLEIGSDVWIGHNAVILPSVSSIGDGAVIGAGAVVHKNIPPYAVVTGNPCRVVRYRFSEAKIAELLASRWWDRSLEDLLPELDEFGRPLEDDVVR